jgi:hypothetical protein
MNLFSLRSSLVLPALAAAALVGCASGPPEAGGEAPAGGQATESAVAAADAFCPPGFAFDGPSQLCLSATEAAGPFPPSMVEFCKRFVPNRPDGTNSCETADGGGPQTRWGRQLAVDARAATRQADGCPGGTSLDAKQGYCSDGANLYGPFSKDDVFFCQTDGAGGAACETNRIAAGLVRPKQGGGGVPGGFDASAEIAVNGATWGKLVVAVGHAEGTLSQTGGKLDAYFGHGDSGLRNIGLWSCTVCGSRSGPEADQFYYEQFIKPEVGRYVQSAGALSNHPMVAAAFFGLLVQSPEAALNDADGDDLAFINLLARGGLSAPVTEDKLLDLLVRSWTVDGVMQWRSPDTGQNDPARGRQDQLRRLRAYAESLAAQGITPYP